MTGRVSLYFTFGPYRLDPEQRLLFRGEDEIPLTPKTFDTLLLLVEHHGRVLMKEDLMKAVWPDTVVEENNLTQSISRLRRVLNEAHDGELIETLPRRGYRFVAPVDERQDTRSDALIHRRTTVRVVEEENVDTRESAAPRARTAVIVALVLIVALLSGSYAWLLRRAQGPVLSSGELHIERLTGSGRAIVAAISPDGAYVAYSTEEGGHQGLWLRQIATESDVQVVPPAPVDYWGLTFSPDGVYLYYTVWERNKRDATLQRVPVLGGPPRQLLRDAGGPISFSPDGSRFAFTIDHASTAESRVMLASADGTNVRGLYSAEPSDMLGSVLTGAAWSPDGSTVLQVSGSRATGAREKRIIAIRVADGRVRSLNEGPWRSIGPLVWLRDGSGFLMSAADAVLTARQIWHVSYPDGRAHQLSNDLHDYSSVSLSQRGDAAAVQTHTLSALWVRPDAGQERVVATEIGDRAGAEGLSWTPDGRIVSAARSRGKLDLWIASVDGTRKRQLTVDAGNNFHPAVSPDGRYVVFASDRSGALAIWRMDLDGGHSVQLTPGHDEVRPAVSPDGRWLVYQQGHGWVKTTLGKVSIDGGDAVQLTTTMSMRPIISPDGDAIAYYSMDDAGWKIAVMPSSGGSTVKTYPIPATGSRVMRWTPDGRGLAYIDDRGDESNVLLQRLDGGRPEHLASFHAGDVVAFDWSPDGRHLAYVRVTRSSDVVRLRGFQD